MIDTTVSEWVRGNEWAGGRKRKMIEKVIQCEDAAGGKNVLFRLPKHIMQIGNSGNVPEIYIEDYAHGYLDRLAANDCTILRVAILVGEFVKSEGKRYVFIRGAMEAESAVEDNCPRFSSEIWADLYGKIKRFFPKYEAVGWFLGGPEYLTVQKDVILQTHLDWFGGRDRILFRVDPVEKNSSVFLYDKGELVKWPGYCIYYEKNEEMQDFLVSGRPQSVDEGYTEPVLARMSQRLGRKPEEEPEKEEIAGGTETETAEPAKESKSDTGKQPERYRGNHLGTGIMAAAALLVLAATGIRYTQNKQAPVTAPTGELIPTPNGGRYLEETFAKPSGAVVSDAKMNSGVDPEDALYFGGDFEEYFQTVTEPVLPTMPAVPTKALTEKTPTAKPAKEIQPTKLPTEKPVNTPVPTKEVLPTKAAEPTKEPQPTRTPKPTGAVDTGTMPGILYVVKSGDTLAAICRRFYGDVSRMEEIKEVNQIPDENKIYAGQELYLP